MFGKLFQMSDKTLERVAYELETLTCSIKELVDDRKAFVGKVQGMEKQLDSCLVTINAINDRLKDVVLFMHKSEDIQNGLALRISQLEQSERDRNLREETTKMVMVNAEAIRSEKQKSFAMKMKLLATVQGIVFIGMEIWHHLSR